MITLHTFGPAFGLPDASPFVLKAMSLLKLAGQSYTTEPYAGSIKLGPKGKRPFITDEGATVADSTFIRFHLESKYGLDFDAHLSPREKGVTWALEKMCEEHLYFAALYFRWFKDENFDKISEVFFESAPALIRPLVPALARAGQRKLIKAQGMGRHTDAEIARLACRDIDALAAVLGAGEWLGGSSPCAADASVSAFVLVAGCEHLDTPLLARIRSHENLTAYAARAQARFFT